MRRVLATYVRVLNIRKFLLKSQGSEYALGCN